MSAIIKVENLSKQYRLGTVGTGTVADDMKRWWHRVRGKEDPFLKIGEVNDRSQKAASDYVWALRDVSFDVQQGEVLGIIGRNGAGKSTLLKILSRVAEPTKGRVTINGRVASLLEVGTGFHPDLTGRENIFLNGAILGMTKSEVKSRFDEIVDFAGVERYIDTPVKRYSSGMYVRLGFAVAAHLEPDILIVDEVLAVGDSEFQSKCIGKIKNISASDNRVVIFVSHNIPSIQKLCSNCLLMHNGSLVMQGSTNDVVTSYLASKTKFATYLFDGSHNSSAVIRKAWCENANAVPCNEVPLGAVWRIVLQVELLKSTKRFICGVGISRMDEISINTSWTTEEALSTGIYEFAFEQNKFQLAHGKYIIHLGLMEGKQVLQYVDNALGIDIVEVKAGLDSRVLDTGPESGFLLDQMPFSWRRLD